MWTNAEVSSNGPPVKLWRPQQPSFAHRDRSSVDEDVGVASETGCSGCPNLNRSLLDDLRCAVNHDDGGLTYVTTSPVDSFSRSPSSVAPRSTHSSTPQSDQPGGGYKRRNLVAVAIPPRLSSPLTLESDDDDGVRRRLFEGDNAKALQDLHRLEYPESQTWTLEERCYLLLLQRSYENSWKDLTKVLNKLFESHYQARGRVPRGWTSVRSQFYDLSFYARDPSWIHVWNESPFDEMETKWRHELEMIDIHAAMVDVDLQRRQEDSPKLSMKKPKLRSSSDAVTRKIRELKRASKVSLSGQILSLCPKPQLSSKSTGAPQLETLVAVGASMPVASPSAAAKPTSTWLHSLVSPHEVSSPAPTILFRVNDEFSAAVRDDRGIVAAMYQRHPVIKVPPSLDYDDYWIQLLAGNHIWHHTAGSPYVSATTSLFETFRRCRRSPRTARVSIIDFDQIRTHTYAAKDLIRKMRVNFDFPGMRYAGTNEWLIVAKIPEKAIVHEFSYQELLNALHANVLDLTRAGGIEQKYRRIRTNLLQNSVRMDAPVAEALGTVCAAFGVKASSSEDFVRFVVEAVIDALVVEFAIPPNTTFIDNIIERFISSLLIRDGGAYSPMSESQFATLKRGLIQGLANADTKLKKERARMATGAARRSQPLSKASGRRKRTQMRPGEDSWIVD